VIRAVLATAALLLLQAASANPVSTDNVTARLVAERAGVAPGEPVDLALILDIRPGWHTYWRNPGDSGEPTRIDWRLPEGVTAGPIRWTYPELIRVGPLANYGYSGRAVHLVELKTPKDWPAGAPLEVIAEASWLVCEEHCIPERAELRLSLPTTNRPAPPDLAVAEIFASAGQRLPGPLPGGFKVEHYAESNLRLAIDLPQPPPQLDSVWFFGGEWGLVEHAADQSWRLENGRLLVGVTPGASAGPLKTAGVLVTKGGGQTRAYDVPPVAAVIPPAADEPSADLGMGLPLALAFALLGGLILNLMPCVFPVLAMKALSLTRSGGLSLRDRVLQGLAYTAGVLGFFALVAALLLALRAGGTVVGWGYQLQHPPFVALMAYLFLLLGLSLAGAITLGSRLMGVGATGPSAGTRGAFVTGALAALVAAPCTAPFMGAALGYAVTLSWPLALAVILTLGFGLALPYLILAVVPGMGRVLPKPGKWMETLKQLLAFPMFATAAWLVWVLSVQAGPPGVAMVLAGVVLLALGLWVWERSRHTTGRLRALAGAVAASSLAAALALGMGIDRLKSVPQQEHAPPSSLAAEAFTPQRLEAARSEGRPVFVNMTAAWCITCLVNERVALSSAKVADAFESAGVLYMKGDWTNRDELITRYLEGFGRSGVPLYVFYPPQGEPRVLPQILTESKVLEVLGPAPSRNLSTES